MRDEDKTREQLIEELSLLNSVIEEMPDIFFIKDLEGRYLFMNQAGLDFGGWSSKQVIGHDDYAIFPKEMVAQLREADEKTISDGITKAFDELVETPTGPVTVMTTKGVCRNKNNEIIGLFGIAKDITEQKKSAEKLKASKEQYERLLNSAPDMVFSSRMDDFKIISVNDRGCEGYGYSREELLNMTIFDLEVDPPTRRQIREIYASMNIGDTNEIYKGVNKRKNGSHFYAHVRFTRIDEEHQVAHVRDISERIDLEAQLRQSQKMESLGTLAGGIAHDFNNILGIILGNTEMCMRKLPEDGKARKHLESIYKSGKRAVNLVRQIMTFSRMDTTSFKPLNLSLVVHEALKMARATIPTNIQIHQNLSEDCPAICADETQMHQIILNLCANAHHAMEETGGTLEITLEEVRDYPSSMDMGDGPCLKLTVKDSGQGIELDDLEQIFDPFFTTKDIGKGTGLGLAVVHGIVEKHRGKITVESQRSQGTVFSIFFPTIEAECQDTRAQDSALKKGNGHILIVEDEPELAILYREFLEGLDYVITVCGDGLDALAKFKENPNHFDLVLTDHAMPNMTGKQLIPKLLDIRSEMPIILSTGYSDLMSEEEAQALGVRKYLMKPFELTLLQDTIEECLSSS